MKTYNCHLKKELQLYCCVVCYDVVHKSCCERTKGWIHLEGHAIYCNKSCAGIGQKNIDVQNIIMEVQKENTTLYETVKQKDDYIAKLTTAKNQINQEAVEMESLLMDELTDKRSLIKQINEDLATTKKKNTQ